jgi:hypothetical protein
VAGAAALAIDKNTYLSDYRWLTEDTDVGVVEVPSRPKRLHPNLSDEAYERIRQPVGLWGASR